MKFLILLMFITGQAHATDFQKYIKLMKNEMGKMLGERPKTLSLPAIPKVEKNALSTAVYSKKGKIFEQGESFNKLSNLEKRKYRGAFLNELYFSVRGAQAQTHETVSGINMLEQGGTREGVYRSLVLSSDYMGLERFEEAPNSQLVIFSLALAHKYFGLDYKKEQVVQLNLWGIKRVMVEKALEIIDSFPTDGENLSVWYGILSSELSQKYTKVWKSQTRKNTDENFHYKWAKQVPLQQIKSEIIIKLHKTMNSLQAI